MVPSDRVQKILMMRIQSGTLNQMQCGQIWQLSNPDGQMSFDKKMFVVVLHLMKKVNEGASLPQSLPENIFKGTMLEEKKP